MKLKIVPCSECFRISGKPSNEISEVELDDRGIHEITCPKGHVTYTGLQQQKFEILFDIGLLALIDGYTDAAVSRFAASLERFCEFCIQVWFYNQDKNEENFIKFWKTIGKQTERQIGAFHTLHSIDLGKHTDLSIPNFQKWATFRNLVIHNGFIPKQEETLEYAEELYVFMTHLLQHLKTNYAEAVDMITRRHMTNMYKKVQPKPFATMSIPTAINICRSNNSAIEPLSSAIESIKKYKIYGIAAA